MPGRFKILIAVIAFAACAWFAGQSLRPRTAFERTYKGRTLVEWTYVVTNGPNAEEISDEKYRAYRLLASNNIPELVEGLNYDPSVRKKRIKAAISPLPYWLQNWLMDGLLADRRIDRVHAAKAGLKALGPDAGAAVPYLEKLIASTNRMVAINGYWALAQVGTNGVPRLLAVMADENEPWQWMAVGAFRVLTQTCTNSTNPAALPLLVKCMQSTNPLVVTHAALYFGDTRMEPATTVPILRAALTNPHPEVLVVAINALAKFGRDSLPAVPELLRALQDPSLLVRQSAHETLLQIAPDSYSSTNPAPYPEGMEAFRRRYGISPKN